MTTAVIHIWSHKSPAEAAPASPVFPDGCRDVIFAQERGKAPRIRLSPRATALFMAPAAQGVTLEGYRLAPHMQLDPLQAQTALRMDMSRKERSARIDELARSMPNVGEALGCIAS